MSGGYAVASVTKVPRIRGANKIKRARHYVEEKPMKLTFKQRIRNWIMSDDSDMDEVCVPDIEPAGFDSDGLRLQVYRASGGYVIETRSYDRRSDRNNNTMHVITDDQDLGQALGKIVMMEALRG
jgi:hypothetical protein